MAALLQGCGSPAGRPAPAGTPWKAEHDLSRAPSTEERCYRSVTTMTKRAEDGSKLSVETVRLHIQVAPAAGPGARARYTCRAFSIESAGTVRRIPALEGHAYEIEPGVDARGQTFGIDHARFLSLRDDRGGAFEGTGPYFVYNTFIDFHGFHDVFARAGAPLRRIGDEAVDASRAEVPVHLGTFIEKGSVYRLGDCRTRFEGIGLVRARPCAILRIDGGEGGFAMNLAPAPGVRLVAKGHSGVKATCHVELDSLRLARCEWEELVVSQVAMGGQPVAREVMVREGRIEELPRDELEREVAAPGSGR